MHAFDLLIKLNAPLRGVDFDQRPFVWCLFAMVVEQADEQDASRSVARGHEDWAHANFHALRLVVSHCGVRYDDLSLLDLMPVWEKAELLQYVIDYFVEAMSAEDRAKLSSTSKTVQMLVPLTIMQIEQEAERYMQAKKTGAEWETSAMTMAAVDKAGWKAKTAKWWVVGKLVMRMATAKA